MAVALTGPVGKKKVNHKGDVVAVQLLLNKFIGPGRLALPMLVADGVCGKKTVAAIKTFQAVYFGWRKPDGVVDPGPSGLTLTALNGDINQPQKGDPSEVTRQTVMKTLKGATGIHFVMNGIAMGSGDLEDIAKLVAVRHIEVVYDPIKGESAEYVHGGANTMLLGFQTAGSTFRQSVIVHEATHAVLDKRAKPQTVLLAEALAFIAQCVYYRQRTGSHIREVTYGPTADVLTQAGNIAIDVLAGKAISDPALKALYDVIPKVPTYSKPYAIYAYNGI